MHPASFSYRPSPAHGALPPPALHRDSIGDAAIAGDTRWAGAFGVNVDLVARSHCSVEMIMLEDMQVRRGLAALMLFCQGALAEHTNVSAYAHGQAEPHLQL